MERRWHQGQAGGPRAQADADADAEGELDWLVAADSSPVGAHQHGASARRVGSNAATTRGEPDDRKGDGPGNRG